MHKHVSIFLPAVLFGVVFPIQANQLRTEDELKTLNTKIDILQTELQSGRSEEQLLVKDLNNLERQIARLAAERFTHKLKLESLKVRKMNLHKKLYDLDLQRGDAQKRLKEVVRSSYILSQQDSIKLVLNQKDPADIVRTLSMYRYIVDSRRKKIEKIREHQLEVKETSGEIENQRVAIDQTLLALDDNKLALQKSGKARQQQISLIRQKLSKGQSQVEVYVKREAELKLLLHNLQAQKIISDQPGTKSVASKSNQTERQPTSLSERKQNNDESTVNGFSKNKGQLPMPTKAEIQNRFGQIKPESGLIWEGLMFDVEEGQNVSAIYPGQVVFSDWFRGYGQLLVLDHGDGYMSLYGHNQLLHVELGSAVEAGQLVAYAGSTGGLAKPGLYFEIRNNGTPDDPLKWCRI